MTMLRTAMAMIVLALAALPLAAQPVDSLFSNAEAAYRAGAFADAITSYETIISGGWASAQVYYNLGNTYYRAGNIGRAILSYERALRLDPTDGDIQHNLELVRLRTVDRIDPLPELFLVTWVRRLNATVPVSITTTLFLIGWGCLFLSLAVMYLVRSHTVVRFMRIAFFSGAGAGVLFGVLLLIQVLVVPRSEDGIIMSPTVTAKSSPDMQSVDAFVVHEGLKVSLGDSIDDWVRITLADGKTGWVLRADVEQV